MLAVRSGKTHAAQRALAVGNHGQATKDIALCSGAELGHADIVRMLLIAGADVHARQDAALLSAAASGYANVINILLAADPEPHDAWDEAMYQAAIGNHVDALRALIGAGADVHVNFGITLRDAASFGQAAAVDYLLRACTAGGNVHAIRDAALSGAAFQGHAEVVRVLLGAGADVHAAHDEALRSAAAGGHGDIVRMLLDAHADLHADHDAALRNAVYRGHVEVVRMLLGAGSNANARQGDDLRVAAMHGHIAVVRALLQAGADPLVAWNGAALHAHSDIAAAFDACGDVMTPVQRAAIVARSRRLVALQADVHAAKRNGRLQRRSGRCHDGYFIAGKSPSGVDRQPLTPSHASIS